MLLNVVLKMILKYLNSLIFYLSVKKVERDSNLKWQTPELMETWTEVNYTICVSTHEVNNLNQ